MSEGTSTTDITLDEVSHALEGLGFKPDKVELLPEESRVLFIAIYFAGTDGYGYAKSRFEETAPDILLQFQVVSIRWGYGKNQQNRKKGRRSVHLVATKK